MIKNISLDIIVGGNMPSDESVTLSLCEYDISNYHLKTHLISDNIKLNNQYGTNKYHFKTLNLHIRKDNFIVFKLAFGSFRNNPTEVYGTGMMSII
jgi:hypothetical protein